MVMILNVSVSEAGKAANVRLETTSALNSTAVNMANVLMFYQPSRMGESAIIHIIPKRCSLSVLYDLARSLCTCQGKHALTPIIKALEFPSLFLL